MYRKNNFSENTVKTLRQNLTQILPESFYQTHEKTSFYTGWKHFKTNRRNVFFQFFTEAPRSGKTVFTNITSSLSEKSQCGAFFWVEMENETEKNRVEMEKLTRVFNNLRFCENQNEG